MITERKPGIFISTLYFAEGLPYTIVMMMSGIFFKSLGADNVFVGLTSFLGLPWILKFAWAPLVDYYATKRRWVILAEIALTCLVAAVAAAAFLSEHMPFTQFVNIAVVVLSLTAIASATHDVAIDGYYLDVLNEEQKAFFVGVRNATYKIAWLFGSGAMVFLAGIVAQHAGKALGWAVAFLICAVSMLACGLFHAWYLPQVAGIPASPVPASTAAETAGIERVNGVAGEKKIAKVASAGPDFLQAIGTYFLQPGIIPIVLYILVFRLGDALMLKQAPNFLLDPLAKGGLAISLADIGIINGTVGMISLLLGGIVGSWLLSRDGLTRWLWPLALFQNSAILLYFALAKWPHLLAMNIGNVANGGNIGSSVTLPVYNPYVPAVYVVNSLEQFAYGMGSAAYTVFLLGTVGNKYKAAHYATATALMAVGIMCSGAVSGYLTQLGYAEFFLISFLASLPGIFTIFFLPIWRNEAKPGEAATGGSTCGISKAGQMGSESK